MFDKSEHFLQIEVFCALCGIVLFNVQHLFYNKPMEQADYWRCKMDYREQIIQLLHQATPGQLRRIYIFITALLN